MASDKLMKENNLDENEQLKLIDDAKQHELFLNFIARNHVVQTKNVPKISLCSFEDKRFWFNNYDSLPHRHYKNWRIYFSSEVIGELKMIHAK